MQQDDATVNAQFKQACLGGDLAVVRRYVEQGHGVESDLGDGCTGLWLAAEAGCVEVVDFLCSIGANANVARLPGGATALFVAAQNGHVSTVQVLLRFLADVDRGRDSGATPLFIAAQQGHLEVVQLLLDAGARPAAPNHQGLLPIMVAAYQGRADCVELLLEAGCDPYETVMGRNAIEWAEAGGHGKEITEAVMRWSVAASFLARAGAQYSQFLPNVAVSADSGDDGGVLDLQGEISGRDCLPEECPMPEDCFNGLRVLPRGRSLVRSASAPLRGRGGSVQAERSRREKSLLSSRLSHVTRSLTSSPVFASKLKTLMERESRENERFRASQRAPFQAFNSLKILEQSQPVNVQKTKDRWNIWIQTLYERVRQMEEAGIAFAEESFCNVDNMF